jgi:hypothetical protein
MAYEKRRLREVDTAGSYSKVQALTEADASTATPVIDSFGFSVINVGTTAAAQANDATFILKAPKAGGVHKYISALSGTTDAVIITTHSTAVTFLGSTNATVTATTGAAARHLQLIATSSTGWSVVGESTGWTFSA